MSIDKQKTKEYLKVFDFKSLFINILGWDKHEQSMNVQIDEVNYDLKAIAHKRGMVAFECCKQSIPDYNIRRKIDRVVSKSVYEHFIIFTDSNKTKQKWLWVKKEQGKPSAAREEEFSEFKSESLIQKLDSIYFTLDEEESLFIDMVSKKVKQAFDIDKVTKKFYDIFKKEQIIFKGFINGISEIADQDWYTSLMLNRLMFVYFIQKKRFLDEDINYLKNKLSKVRELKGKNKFYSFYRNFLIELFHKGFSVPVNERDDETIKLIGKIPYLNGGLFDLHQLEKKYPGIQIDDEAFKKVFLFFDSYQWRLDDRPLKKDDEINPDVLGYIFEKYINQKQMGAYYTKEDITEYISKNTIIPYIFDEAKKECSIAFKSDSALWQMLKYEPERYIYDAVKHGIAVNAREYPPKPLEKSYILPENISIGIDTSKPDLIERRKDWNKPAPEEFALPTEIWREVVDRRKRYEEIINKILNGEIIEINDFITYNLNIRQFAQDVIENCEGPELLRAIYFTIAGRKSFKSNEKSKSGISILDPACGSGAFLFAALNILEPLYEACLERMKRFIEEYDSNPDNKSKKYSDFREILNEISTKHANTKYFIYKSIILNNLYGVDIMNEAVEIAKLRLFLKLISQVDKFEDIEALPDIDFNIRCGNTLVGFATYDEAKEVISSRMNFDDTADKIYEEAEEVSMSNERYKTVQRNSKSNSDKLQKAKEEHQKRLNSLNEILNKYLSYQYGISEKYPIKYNRWKISYQPFHWFVEFYEFINDKGGFDCVIGNPPYVEYDTKLKMVYTLKNYETIDCGNLHAFFAERCFKLISLNSYIGLIVPLPSINTSRMVNLQNLIKPKINMKGRNIWISAYDERPSSLFDGVDQRLIIEIIGNENSKAFLNTTGIKRWYSTTRNYLFSRVYYSTQSNTNLNYTSSILKIKNDKIETKILNKFYSNKSIAYLKSDQPTKHVIYYRTAGGRYWKVVVDKPSGTETVSEKPAYFRYIQNYQAISLISSSTFWWYYSSHFDMFNLKDYMIFGFKFSDAKPEILTKLEKLGKEYLNSLEKNAEIQNINSKTKGLIEQKQYFINKSKSIIDKIDRVLAEHFGFTEEELDFIINYDIKYRMGKEQEVE